MKRHEPHAVPFGSPPDRVIDAAAPEATMRATRVGYARCSTAQPELQSQLDALEEAGCDPVFSEKISTRIKVRPEFVKAMGFARTVKKAVPHQRVIFTVHEMKRPHRPTSKAHTTRRGTGKDFRAQPGKATGVGASVSPRSCSDASRK